MRGAHKRKCEGMVSGCEPQLMRECWVVLMAARNGFKTDTAEDVH